MEEVERRGEKAAMISSIVIYVAALLFLSFITDANIFIVFLATLPVLLYIIVLFYFVRIDHRMALLWILPIIFPLLFLFLTSIGILGFMKRIDVQVVAVIDIIISYIINIFVVLFIRKSKTSAQRSVPPVVVQNLQQELSSTRKELAHKNHKLEDTATQLEEARDVITSVNQKIQEIKVTRENLDVVLRSIEDKCKAINFVIGRVYSNKRGGSKEIRDKLRIGKEYYNEFSSISQDMKPGDAPRLHALVDHIYNKLLALEHQHGHERIIDHLVKNDADPVMDYHSEAKEICRKIMEYLDSYESVTNY